MQEFYVYFYDGLIVNQIIPVHRTEKHRTEKE